MPKYKAVPYLSDEQIKIYDTSGTVVSTIALNRPGANAVVPFLFTNASASAAYLFVSYDEFNTAGSATSHIDIFDISTVTAPVLKSSLPLSNAVCGMAIQPGTKDLYVATFSNDITNGAANTTNPGGVFAFTSASGYTASKYGTIDATNGKYNSFVDYNSPWEAVADVCANLAFDPHGNLWMTTYTAGDTDPATHFLVCFTQVDGNPASSAKFFKLSNGGQLAVTPLPNTQSTWTSPLYPFAEPHAISFDPLGNLWMANNNDDTLVNPPVVTDGPSGGSLLRLERAWIDTHLLTNTTLLGDLTINGYGGTQTLAADPNVTLYSFADGRFGGLSFDGFNLYVSDQSQTDPFHQTIWALNTEGLAANTAPTAAQFASSGLATSYPGNDTIAIFNTTPAKLFISHIAGDTGQQEPDAASYLWQSPDIGVVNDGPLDPAPAPTPPPNVLAATGAAFDIAQDGSISANKALLYVRVANIGQPNRDPPTTGTEVLRAYFAKASAGLDWPAPWDGLSFDGGHTNLPYGGQIGAVSVGQIDPGHETIFTIPWTKVPPEQSYSTPDGHFCLIARVERASLYPFGMDYPEAFGTFAADGQDDLSANVRNNLPIAWRNIAITETKAGDDIHRIRMGVLGANHVAGSRVMRFALETLDCDGKPSELPGTFMLLATDQALERLRDAAPDCYLGDGRFRLHDMCVRFHPHEVLPFWVEYETPHRIPDFAVRILQYVVTEKGDKLMGGQTFVVGKVRGLNAR
jgi:hypothetical protein